MKIWLIGFLVNRLKEPSSWASLAVLLGFMGYKIEDELWQHIVTAGVGAFALIGFIAKENNKPEIQPSVVEEIVVKKAKSIGAKNGNYNK